MVRIHLQLLVSTFALFRHTLSATVGEISAASKPVDNTPNLSHNKLYKLNVNFWDTFLYPKDDVEAKKINSTIFATDVKGRIDATRTFEGQELNTEYLFGLFANLAATDSHQLSLLGVPISYEIVKFTANDYITSASTIVMFNFTSLGTVIPVEIDTWIAWNSNGEMTQYDGTFKYWQWLQDYVVSKAYVSSSLYPFCLACFRIRTEDNQDATFGRNDTFTSSERLDYRPRQADLYYAHDVLQWHE